MAFETEPDLLTVSLTTIYRQRMPAPLAWPFNPFSPTQSNVQGFGQQNIIVLALGCVYVLGRLFLQRKVPRKILRPQCMFSLTAKECPFYVKDGCQHFCGCLIPIFMKCLTRFVVFSDGRL